jgi:hypothetical protein
MADLSWEAQERLHLATPPPKPTVTDDLTKVIALLGRMLTEYHEKRPDRPLRRHL